MSFTRDDVEQILAEIARFATDRIAAATARPEAALSPRALDELTQEAAELGLLTSSDAEEGFGLWSSADAAEGMALNIGLLQILGQANAGIAYHWHRLAIASVVARRLGVGLSEGALFIPTGHFGLAHGGLAKYLQTGATSAEEENAVSDWFDRREKSVIAFGPETWRQVLWPVWSGAGIAWRTDPRDMLDVTVRTKAHGFDELAAFEIRRGANSDDDGIITTEDSAQIYVRALKMDAIGLMAVAAGAARHTQSYAENYVAIRKQGGQLIGRHPAVQLAIGEIESACALAEGVLRKFERPIDDIDLGDVVASRIMLHPALRHAANQSMQSHGGIGYMRDTGPEKILRDENMLSMALGGMRAGALFVAAWRNAKA